MKIVCSPDISALTSLSDARGILLFSRANRSDIGSIGASIKEQMEKHKYVPDSRAWDFLALALSVFAADEVVARSASPDGWTREIDLNVAVSDAAFWNSQKAHVDKAVQFLTTDKWNVTFSASDAGRLKSPDERTSLQETSVSLLSGGMDSLIGAVDAATRKESVLLVSQVANGDSGRQSTFAKSLQLNHLQLTHGFDFSEVTNEPSTRSRSIVFVAYGLLGATLLDSYQSGSVRLHMPENGFISINPPLTDARLGGLSTRTTHPVFLQHLHNIFDAAQLRVELHNPYQFRTKGEMMKECLDQAFILAHAHESTSCGRFVRTGYKHCGRCVPCLIRRSAFHAAGISDNTAYKYRALKKNDKNHARFDDVRSAAMAVAMVNELGLDSWIGTGLSSTQIPTPARYKDVVRRGIEELGAFIKASGVK